MGKNISFLGLFRLYIEHHRQAQNIFEKRKVDTIRNYEAKYSLVTTLLFSNQSVQVKATEFSIPLAKKLFESLSAKYSHNYAARIIDICRTVLKFGMSENIINSNPISSYQLKKLPPDKPVYLTPAELGKWEAYIPKNTMLSKAKDMFLFQCYTGVDYGDLITVSKDNIEPHENRFFILKNRMKTGCQAIIPYIGIARDIFEKYNYNLNLMQNQPYNRALKDIADELGIKKNITTHVGRKTYAMFRLNYKRNSIEAVSKMIGHKSVKTTESYYAQVTIDLVVGDLNRIGD